MPFLCISTVLAKSSWDTNDNWWHIILKWKVIDQFAEPLTMLEQWVYFGRINIYIV